MKLRCFRGSKGEFDCTKGIKTLGESKVTSCIISSGFKCFWIKFKCFDLMCLKLWIKKSNKNCFEKGIDWGWTNEKSQENSNWIEK
jgi:hypothetical protein